MGSQLRIVIRLGCWASILLFGFGVKAQDPHFSQCYQQLYYYSPALVGHFTEDYQFTVFQRQQWQSITKPYESFGIIAETNTLQKFHLKTGLALLNDVAGDGKLRTTAIQLPIAYDLKINKLAQIRFGITPAITQRSLILSNLTFNNQFNGNKYDPNIDSQENIWDQTHWYADISAGLAAIFYFKQFNFTAGWGSFHLNKPIQSFNKDPNSKLAIRNVFYAQAQIPLAIGSLEPMIVAMQQEEFNELMIGTNLRMSAEKFGYNNAFITGIYYRTNDALSLQAGFSWPGWETIFSYDITTSRLVMANNGRGGLEITLRHKIIVPKEKRKLFQNCPDFI